MVTKRPPLASQLPHAEVLRYRNILDSLPDMVGYWDRGLLNRFANRAYMTWLGLPPESISGMHIKDVLGDDLFRLNQPYIDKVLAGEEQSFERQVANPHTKVVRNSLAHYIPDVRKGQVVGFFVLVSDVTQLKQSETALKESRKILEENEERFRNVLMDQTELISRVRADGSYIFANEVYCRFFGKSMEEICSSSWHPMVYPDDKERVLHELSALSSEKPMITIENRVVSGTGELHWMQFSNRGFFSDSGELTQVQSVGRDITQRKTTELESLKLNTQLETTQTLLRHFISENDVRIERERKHLAQEVHDELGQALTALLIDIHFLEMRYKAFDQDFDAKIQGMKALVDTAIRGVRDVASNLRPVAIDMGLTSALAWLCTEHSRKTEARCQFQSSIDTKFIDPGKALVLFRIVQESLTNIARHANASSVVVSLDIRSENLSIEVADNGRGFDAKTVDAKRSLGLLGMRERVIGLEGDLQIQSLPGKGTKILVCLPLATIREGG